VRCGKSRAVVSSRRPRRLLLANECAWRPDHDGRDRGDEAERGCEQRLRDAGGDDREFFVVCAFEIPMKLSMMNLALSVGINLRVLGGFYSPGVLNRTDDARNGVPCNALLGSFSKGRALP
jgi:hypothetical protein